MATAYFSSLSDRVVSGTDGVEQARWLAGEQTVGPWSPALQHGGPPNALAVVLADRAVRARTGRDDLVPLRLAGDFVGPVPVGEITTSVRVIRVARSAALAEVTVSGGERDCLVARIWFVRAADTAGIATADTAPPAALPAERTRSAWTFGYGASIDWRYVAGGPDVRGPAAVWARSTLPLIEGDPAPLPGLARVVLVADSASGISAELDWSEWSFVNVDLDVHLLRPLQGEWVLLDAATSIGAAGSALARSAISDAAGPVGAGLQTLVVAAIPTR